MHLTWRISYEQTSFRFGTKDVVIDSHLKVQVLNGFGDGYQRGHLRTLVLKVHLRVGNNELRRELVPVVLKMWIGVHLGVELQVAESLLVPGAYYSIELRVGGGVQLHFGGLVR